MELVDGIEAQIRRVLITLKQYVKLQAAHLQILQSSIFFLLIYLISNSLTKLWANILLNHTQLVLHLVASLPKGALVEMDGIVIINQ